MNIENALIAFDLKTIHVLELFSHRRIQDKQRDSILVDLRETALTELLVSEGGKFKRSFESTRRVNWDLVEVFKLSLDFVSRHNKVTNDDIELLISLIRSKWEPSNKLILWGRKSHNSRRFEVSDLVASYSRSKSQKWVLLRKSNGCDWISKISGVEGFNSWT